MEQKKDLKDFFGAPESDEEEILQPPTAMKMVKTVSQYQNSEIDKKQTGIELFSKYKNFADDNRI